MRNQTDTPANEIEQDQSEQGDVLPRRSPVARANSLAATASQPGVDPCDVACEAMPAQLVGDLSADERAWLLDHTAGCRDCANELDHYEQVGGALDRLHQQDDEAAPPTIPLPRRPRAGYTRLESPVGPLLVAVSAAGICEIDFAVHDTFEGFIRRLRARGFDPYPLDGHGGETGAAPGAELIARALDQLREYFAGQRHQFDLALDFTGVTPFTRAVLEATATVPFGHLDTYRNIAHRVGKPRATRAVGNALGRNPLPIVCPCHRIIRTDHSLGGYTGGLQIKQHLLAVEGVALP